MKKPWLAILWTTPYEVGVMIRGRVYTYTIDGIHIPLIETHYSRGRLGCALKTLKAFALSVDEEKNNGQYCN